MSWSSTIWTSPERLPATLYLAGCVVQVAQAHGLGPAVLAMVEHDRDDDGQASGPAVLPEMVVPGVEHVAQQAQAHEALGLALVLEQQIEVRGFPGQAYAKQQIRETRAQLIVDEARGLRLQRIDVDVPHDPGRQHRAE
jgi:hypothetical protein